MVIYPMLSNVIYLMVAIRQEVEFLIYISSHFKISTVNTNILS